MDSIRKNSTSSESSYTHDEHHHHSMDGARPSKTRSSRSSSSATRRKYRGLYRTDVEPFSMGNSLFSYAAETHHSSTRKGSSSSSSHGGGDDHHPSSWPAGTGHGSTDGPAAPLLSKSDQSLLREIGAALTLPGDGDWLSSE